MIYVIALSPWFWQEYGADSVGYNAYDLWIANYEVSKPDVPEPWTNWTFWQWTDKGDGHEFGAESAGLDMIWYNGSWDDFVEQFGEIGEPPEPPPQGDYADGWNDALNELEAAIEEMRNAN
jgi:hypothetical protein